MRVMLGIRNYRVDFHDEVLLHDGELFNGYIHYPNEQIDISHQQSFIGERQTLLHEITHAIFRHLGVHQQDEQVVDGLATMMLEVLRRNPDVVHYLLEEPLETL